MGILTDHCCKAAERRNCNRQELKEFPLRALFSSANDKERSGEPKASGNEKVRRSKHANPQ